MRFEASTVAASILCISFLVAGCAERKVVGNTFLSSSPRLNIPVDQSFKYLGKMTTDNSGPDYYNPNRTYFYQTESYLFVPRDASQRMDRFLLISITNTSASGYINTLQNDMRNLDIGTIDMQGDTYNCYSVMFTPPGMWSVNKLVKESGYWLPSCLLVRIFDSLSQGSTRIRIYYYEDAAASGMTCRQRYSRDGLTDYQQRYLQELHQRALKIIGG